MVANVTGTTLHDIEGRRVQIREKPRRRKNFISVGGCQKFEELQELVQSIEPSRVSHRLKRFCADASRISGKQDSSQRQLKKFLQRSNLGQVGARPSQLLGIELYDEVSGVDSLPGANVRDPIVGKAAAYNRQMARREFANVITDEYRAGRLADEVDLELRVKIPYRSRP